MRVYVYNRMVIIKSEEVDEADTDSKIDGALVVCVDVTKDFTTDKVSI